MFCVENEFIIPQTGQPRPAECGKIFAKEQHQKSKQRRWQRLHSGNFGVGFDCCLLLVLVALSLGFIGFITGHTVPAIAKE